MIHNSNIGTLRTPFVHFSLSSFLNAYCFTDSKDGSIKYFTDKVEAGTKAIELSKTHNVALKPVQGNFVIILNLK